VETACATKLLQRKRPQLLLQKLTEYRRRKQEARKPGSETSLKGKKKSLKDEDQAQTTAAKKKFRYECSTDGCTILAKIGGLCWRHGAKTKAEGCSIEGSTDHAIS
jgi:hypothetical protein